jgi:hypothetical protein
MAVLKRQTARHTGLATVVWIRSIPKLRMIRASIRAEILVSVILWTVKNDFGRCVVDCLDNVRRRVQAEHRRGLSAADGVFDLVPEGVGVAIR